MMKRLVIALFALAATGTLALADFAKFEKTNFESLVNSKAPVLIHSHEWW